MTPRIRLLDGRVKLRHLLLVDALTEKGSLVAAAAHLRVTQPVLTRALRELEGIVGAELYERGARGTVPTPHGTALTHHARAVVAQLRLAERHLTELADGERGTVTVGSHLAGSDALLPEAIARLKKARPQVTVVVSKSEPETLLNDLETGLVDVVVRRLTSAVARATTQQRVLYREPLRFTVRRDHPAVGDTHVDVEDLMAWTWLVPSPGVALRAELESWLAERDLELPTDRVECTSFAVVRQLVLHADMVCVLPIHLGGDEAIVALPVSLAPLGQAIGVITPAGRPTSPAVAALLHELDTVAAELRSVD